MQRRTFLALASATSVGLILGDGPAAAADAAPPVPAAAPVGPFQLMQLPYATNAFEPHISTENIELHYGKHHRGYVATLNRMVAAGTVDGTRPLEDIIRAAGEGPVFNAAAQIWNHDCYWRSMAPNGGGQPSGPLMAALVRDFGSWEDFVTVFTAAALGHFGSGWAWLVVDHGRLAVTTTSNADCPLMHGQTALLTCDVWEHAYYPTYHQLRAAYVAAFLTHLVNWPFAAANLAAAS